MADTSRIIAPHPLRPRSRNCEISEEVTARYADELRHASPLRKCILWFRIRKEISRESKKRTPSPYSLYNK